MQWRGIYKLMNFGIQYTKYTEVHKASWSDYADITLSAFGLKRMTTSTSVLTAKISDVAESVKKALQNTEISEVIAAWERSTLILEAHAD